MCVFVFKHGNLFCDKYNADILKLEYLWAVFSTKTLNLQYISIFFTIYEENYHSNRRFFVLRKKYNG